MKKRASALFLLLFLLGMLCVTPAAAVLDDSAAVRTVRALGILEGDDSGWLDLNAGVTRAQFAKMLSAASTYKDTISPEGTGYSLYKDVKCGHWASEYIRLAVQEGWMTGYTDGTFRPENTVTLEEACSSALRLLGYDTASLAGSFPYAQLSKASALGLRDGINRTRGENITRGDCASLFYNLLTASNASGQVYATTLGYTVVNNEVNYVSVMLEKVNSPYVAKSGDRLPFTPAVLYRNGAISSSALLSKNDVYYYSRELDSAWIFTERVSGKIESISAGSGGQETVTILGKSYTLGNTDAAYQLSALSGTGVDSYVTLLLGMDHAVAGVLTGDEVNGTYYGVIQSGTPGANTEKGGMQVSFDVFCMDGVVRSFAADQDEFYPAGNAVTVTITNSGVRVKPAVVSRLSGKVNAAATKIGNDAFAEDIRILDMGRAGAAIVVEPDRLAGLTLDSRDVRFHTVNAGGEIDNIILDDATGDTWTYGYLTDISGSTESAASGTSTGATYTWISDGTTSSYKSSGAVFPVTHGAIGLVYESNGTTLRTMLELASVQLEALDAVSATANNRVYRLAGNVQVYLKQDDTLYLTKASAVNPDDYTLTGWYDNFTGSAGGAIRIIIATPN